MGKILSILGIGMLLACLVTCAANVAPGTLTETIRRNELQRTYAVCIQQHARNTADLRRHCKRMYVLAQVNWAWEDCINEGVLDCGDRPRYEDIK